MLDDLQSSISPHPSRSGSTSQQSRTSKSVTSSSVTQQVQHKQQQQHSVSRRLFTDEEDSRASPSINTSPGVTPSSLKAANQSNNQVSALIVYFFRLLQCRPTFRATVHRTIKPGGSESGLGLWFVERPLDGSTPYSVEHSIGCCMSSMNEGD